MASEDSGTYAEWHEAFDRCDSVDGNCELERGHDGQHEETTCPAYGYFITERWDDDNT